MLGVDDDATAAATAATVATVIHPEARSVLGAVRAIATIASIGLDLASVADRDRVGVDRN